MMSYPEPYLQGIRLFNAREFWHAHEQWEICWHAAQEPARTYFKGIIQAAAALVHWQRGNLRGLERNWAKARPRLVALPVRFMGLDLPPFVSAMDCCVLSQGSAAPPVIVLLDESTELGGTIEKSYDF